MNLDGELVSAGRFGKVGTEEDLQQRVSYSDARRQNGTNHGEDQRHMRGFGTASKVSILFQLRCFRTHLKLDRKSVV